MASSSAQQTKKVIEGVFAINKPQWASSAGVLRDLQTHFQPSALFAPWLDSQRRHMILSGSRKRDIEKLKVKVGHGGTLDPMATGVLIVGVGKGTKCLQRFLECTKSYECVVLFGAATDSYDAVGKLVSKAPYEHVTRELVEEKLAQFRGKIMQKPSIFSALKVDGKKMYEYARAGGEVPEIQARPVEVQKLELVEWLQAGSHKYAWPKEEVGGEEKLGAQKLMGVHDKDRGFKRPREEDHDDHVSLSEEHPKRPRTDDEPAMSGALPTEDREPNEEPSIKMDQTEQKIGQNGAETQQVPAHQPPAARLKMTVTSGFYVRSLCHDLGLACNSMGLMSSLVRSRQGDYTLGENVLEYSDLESKDIWEPKVRQYLEDFMTKEGWEPEEVEDEETWQAKKKERDVERREGDRDRSYQGKKSQGGGGGSWKGKGNKWKNGR